MDAKASIASLCLKGSSRGLVKVEPQIIVDNTYSKHHIMQKNAEQDAGGVSKRGM